MAFMYQVYGWMFGGLTISAAIAYWAYITPAITDIVLLNELVFFSLLILQLILVVILARVVHGVSSSISAIIFILYSALNGLTLSVIFFVFQSNSIITIFLITAGLFGVMSLYGYYTKKDLTTIGHLATMGLLGLVFSMFINLLLKSSALDYILSAIGVLLFTVLTAFDTQKLKWLFDLGRTEGSGGEKKEAINGALTLYLDFINLFLDLLSLFGKRR